MPKIWRSDISYDLLRRYSDMTTRVFFSSIKVEGRQNYPDLSKYAVILASNHVNTLMDPLVILQDRLGATAFGARADIFKKPRVASLLRWARIVPMARERDGIESIRENFNVFSEVVTCLGHGIPFCLYVEGTHFPGYEVHKVRNGIFHIAASAVEQLDKPVVILPVGLSYNNFYNARNKVVISYGEPIKAEDILAIPNRDRSEKLRELIQAQVHDVSGWGKRKISGPVLWLQRIIAAPLFAIFSISGAPVWIPAEILVNTRKDKAWSNSMRFLAHFVMMIIMTIVAAPLLFCLLHWYCALGTLILLWISPKAFYSILKVYKNENR